jgi:hypothetical protein
MATNLRNYARKLSDETSDNREPLPKADVWMNVGYEADDVNSDGEEVKRFIGTPLGIAIDTQSPIDTSNTRSADLAKVQTYQNQLLADLQAEAQSLAPGEERIVNLQVQMRRVKAPVSAPAATASDALARRAPLFQPSQAPAKAEK